MRCKFPNRWEFCKEEENANYTKVARIHQSSISTKTSNRNKPVRYDRPGASIPLSPVVLLALPLNDHWDDDAAAASRNTGSLFQCRPLHERQQQQRQPAEWHAGSSRVSTARSCLHILWVVGPWRFQDDSHDAIVRCRFSQDRYRHRHRHHQ